LVVSFCVATLGKSLRTLKRPVKMGERVEKRSTPITAADQP
jgi:hypothetical protein